MHYSIGSKNRHEWGAGKVKKKGAEKPSEKIGRKTIIAQFFFCRPGLRPVFFARFFSLSANTGPNWILGRGG